MKRILMVSVMLVVLLLGAGLVQQKVLKGKVGGTATQPTPKAGQPTSPAGLQKQIERLNQRMEALEGRVGRTLRPSSDSLERRVIALEGKVGGQFSLPGLGGLSDLERRVSALERKSEGSRW